MCTYYVVGGDEFMHALEYDIIRDIQLSPVT